MSGQFVNGIRNEDVQRLSFANNRFELISCTEVFEHVPHYLAGFSEIFRVLRPGGYFIFTVPLFESPTTEAVCRLLENGELQWLKPIEYHDSQVTGVQTVPVFWHHSRYQIIRDLLTSGFGNARVEVSNSYSPLIAQLVVVARK